MTRTINMVRTTTIIGTTTKTKTSIPMARFSDKKNILMWLVTGISNVAQCLLRSRKGKQLRTILSTPWG
jgi:hypothetical protein